MKSIGRNVETPPSNHRRGAHRARNCWMVPVVAFLKAIWRLTYRQSVHSLVVEILATST